jgi:hypothetical protein
MGNSKGLGDTFMHTRQHRTLSPMAKPVAYDDDKPPHGWPWRTEKSIELSRIECERD